MLVKNGGLKQDDFTQKQVLSNCLRNYHTVASLHNCWLMPQLTHEAAGSHSGTGLAQWLVSKEEEGGMLHRQSEESTRAQGVSSPQRDLI